MQKAYDGYHRLGYWFLLLIPMVLLAFYKSYFSIIFEPKANIVHVHFALMALWVVTLIVQPLLIVYKKISLHRTIGKFSYILVPALLTAAYLMVRYSYSNYMSANATKFPDHQILLREAASYQGIAVIYWLWLFIFYGLGIIHRQQSKIHARYMMAAAFTMLGPTVDRIWYIALNVSSFPGNLPVESCSFFIADALLIFFLARDYKNKRNVKPLWTALIIFTAFQLFYFTGTRWPLYTKLFTYLM